MEQFAQDVNPLVDIEMPADRVVRSIDDLSKSSAIMVSFGGDGTFLEGIRWLNGAPVPIIGVNVGHLGFLATVSECGICQMLEDIEQGRLTIEKRSILEVESSHLSSENPPLAVNEFAVQRQGASMIEVEAYVDGQMVATYNGDGVLLSTPTGSTAYSLSVGGPVVAPQCQCFVISPLAPHNLTMRPVVIPDTSEVLFKIRSRNLSAFVSLDNVTC